jgi:hypothetical protein
LKEKTMFRHILIALVLCGSSSAWALKCAQPLPTWWPAVGGSISIRPIIVLQHEHLDAAWLEGPNKIAVEIKQIRRGLTLVIPKAPLNAGQTYTLRGINTDRFAEGPFHQARRSDARSVVRWTVKADASPAPVWTGEVKAGKAVGHDGRWGATSNQTLTLGFESAAPAIAEIKLTRGETTYWVMQPVEPGGTVRFGRTKCRKGIHLAGEGDWTADVTLIGPSGQRSKTRRVTFASPKPTPGLR